ncbi:MAG: hypothetical protein ACJ8CB_33770 [Ktedonobacteraceae bacterium]
MTQALTLAQRNHDMQVLCGVQGLLAEWNLLTGRAADARERLAPLLEAPGPTVSYSKEALALLAWAFLESGEAEQAQALLAQVLSTARFECREPRGQDVSPLAVRYSTTPPREMLFPTCHSLPFSPWSIASQSTFFLNGCTR